MYSTTKNIIIVHMMITNLPNGREVRNMPGLWDAVVDSARTRMVQASAVVTIGKIIEPLDAAHASAAKSAGIFILLKYWGRIRIQRGKHPILHILVLLKSQCRADQETHDVIYYYDQRTRRYDAPCTEWRTRMTRRLWTRLSTVWYGLRIELVHNFDEIVSRLFLTNIRGMALNHRYAQVLGLVKVSGSTTSTDITWVWHITNHPGNCDTTCTHALCCCWSAASNYRKQSYRGIPCSLWSKAHSRPLSNSSRDLRWYYAGRSRLVDLTGMSGSIRTTSMWTPRSDGSSLRLYDISCSPHPHAHSH